jgi:hypothetical protein
METASAEIGTMLQSTVNKYVSTLSECLIQGAKDAAGKQLVLDVASICIPAFRVECRLDKD